MKKQFNSSQFALAFLITSAIAMTGCGNAPSASSMLSSIQVSSYTQNGDLWASMTAQLATGSMILAGVSIPIVDPKNPAVEYGSLSLVSNLCPSTSVCAGGGTLTVAVDITSISHSTSVSNTLPNGTMIPVGQAASSSIVSIPLGSGGARLYVAFGQGIALLGVALPFSALNGVGQYAPGVDIFEPFAINSINGIVGLFTGSAANTTGIGLFVDLSSLISPTPAPSAVASASVSAQAMVASVVPPSAPAAEPLVLNEVKPSYNDEQAVYYKLWKLNNKHTQLILK